MDIKEKIKNKKTRVNPPKWLDCSWRRVPCGRPDCPICGYFFQKQARLKTGQGQAFSASFLYELREHLWVALAKNGQKNKFFDPDIVLPAAIKKIPPPAHFPACSFLRNWRNDLFRLADTADENWEAWPLLDQGQDLLWYANTLFAKTYHQAVNRWCYRNFHYLNEEDFVYTDYVISEAYEILLASLATIIDLESGPKNKFKLAFVMLTSWREEIFSGPGPTSL